MMIAGLISPVNKKVLNAVSNHARRQITMKNTLMDRPVELETDVPDFTDDDNAGISVPEILDGEYGIPVPGYRPAIEEIETSSVTNHTTGIFYYLAKIIHWGQRLGTGRIDTRYLPSQGRHDYKYRLRRDL
jgi:hypothetical protein